MTGHSLKAATVLLPIAVVLLACAFLVSPGLFNIDEVVVLAGAQAFLSTGGFAVENGLSEFSSPHLNLWILVPGPHGLAPQYPVGPAVLGAPLLAVFGARGLMLLNVLAAIGTLFALWTLGRRHFGGKGVALVSVLLLLGATFWLEYAYAIWPHSVGVLCVTLALLLVLDALDGEARFELKALAAGAVIGLGLLFRTDTILALPAIGLIAILFAKRPFRLLTFVGVGFLPFVALTSAANYAKFGTLNPLSYGKTTPGGTTLSSHLVPIAGLALVSLVLVASRFVKWRPGRREYAIALAAVVLVLVVSPAARAFAQHYLAGAWALAVDSTTIHDPRPGMQAGSGGVLSFWGLWKKALGQSMPWLGLLFLAFHGQKDGQFRRLQWIVLILAAVWTLPFFMKAWHGGMGSNMRYFLPLVPVLCAVSARLLIDFARPIANVRLVLLIGALAGAGAIALWTAFHPTHDAGAQQILSTWILAAVAGLAVVSGLRWKGQEVVRIVCLGAIGSGLAASTLFLTMDFRQAQAVRAVSESLSVATADLPDRTLVYAAPTFISHWTFQPGHVAAMPGRRDESGRWDGSVDHALIDQALAKGYRVLVWPDYVDHGLRDRYGPRLGASGITYPGGELFEVKASAQPG
ncbi:MAG TPA: glycosyltransferase family 39 protein [Caulobacteraceae bacterium]|nr:glycosyltransferase family 39 protein [Caulobacteraceae bacterium]